jgi:hypothetical protein
VHPKYILTAAHCIQDKQDEKPKLPQHCNFIIGKHNLQSEHEENYRVMGISKFIPHNDWNPFRKIYDADIALAVLAFPLELTRYIHPICLPNPKDNSIDLTSKSGLLAGWGLSEKLELSLTDPKIIEIPVISERECLKSHKHFEDIMSNRGFCTAGDLKRGACQGEKIFIHYAKSVIPKL